MTALADLPALLTRLRDTRRALDQAVGEARTVATTGRRLTGEIQELTGQVTLH